MAAALKSWTALGTSVHVVATDADGLGRATTAVGDVLEDVDTAYSRFREDSELSRLNASPGRTVRVSPLLATAIDAAQRAARLTDGAVDPTIGHAIRVAGYDDDFSRIAAHDGPVNLRAWRVPGWQAIRFDRRSRTVLLPPGVELDLGSTGKALAADLAAQAALSAAGAGGVLVSLGGDIATAGTPPPEGWRIHVAEDSRETPDSEGEVICLPAGGVATSSTTVRRWTRGAAVLHHIIDPQTSLPTTGPFRTVTVAAVTCLDANIASTAAIVRGEGAIDWLMSWGLPARLVENDGTIHYIGRWPDPSGVAA
ncbi:MAG TPA: FAD:protein FMN transferase [Candidatus Dormibacteraeota bacterium]|nr:FAD:protein FMN transferase [Candidatus Dormibacteraeota bacterium]